MPLNKIIVSLIVIFFFISVDMKSQLSGIKRIGGLSSDYPTIKVAVDSLVSQGIDSSVVFEIESGIYYVDELTIDSIAGANELDTIIFISLARYSDSVIIKNNSDDPNYLVKLNGCERVTFKSVTFDTSEETFPNHVIIRGGASYNRFENCVFKAKTELSCENKQDGIVIHDEPTYEKNQFNKFINNKIIGGCIGISLEGKTGELEKGNKIIGNEFTEQLIKSVEVLHNSEGVFNNNTVIYKEGGVAVTLNLDSAYEVQGNAIYSKGSTALFIDTFNAQQPKAYDPLANPVKSFVGLSVFNNKVSCPDGIALKGNKIEGLSLVHNTFFNKSNEQYTIDIDSVKFMVSAFNLLVNKADYGVFKITSDAVVKEGFDRELGSDFNGVYSGADSLIGRFNETIYTTIEDWRTNIHEPDPNSFFGKIEFNNDTTGLELICGTSPSMRLKNISEEFLSVIKPKDIKGNPRDASKFWIGHSDVSIKINVNGYITDSLGTDTITAGKVEVFVKKTNKNILEEIRELNISDGSYTFDSLPYRGNYWLKIIPDKDLFPDYIPSYHTKELRWDASDDTPRPLSDFCIDTIVYNIFPRKLVELPPGDYTISGNISQTGEVKKMYATDPIPGLDVILDRIPPSPPTSIAITQTDQYGNYTFSNLPASNYDGDSDGKYIVTIDYQGLPKDTLYEIKLEGDIDSIINLNYCVDPTEQIQGCYVPMVGRENHQLKDVLLYPNPMGETLTISGVGGKFDLSIHDTRGRKIMNMVNQREDALISTVDFQSGLYFIVIKTSDGDSMYKIVK